MSIERSEPLSTPPERQPVRRQTLRELSIVADTADRVSTDQTKERDEVLVHDPFLAALHLPPNWSSDQPFLNAFNKSIIGTIEELRPDTVDSETIARSVAMQNELKRRLGLLPESVDLQAAQTSGVDMLQYLATHRGSYPGRLVIGDKEGLKEGTRNGALKYRAWLMSQAVYLFANERMPVDDMVEKRFGGDEQARMLLKGGVAEILRARTEHDKKNRWQG